MLKLLLGLAAALVVAGLGYLAGPRLLRPAAAPTATVAVAQPTAEVRSAAPAAAAGTQTSVDITQDQLTRLLQQRLVGQTLGQTPLGSARLTSVSAQLRNGQLYASGSADVGSTSVPVDLNATLGAENGRAVVAVQQAHAAGMPVPDAMRQRLQQSIQDQVDQQVAGLGLRLQSLTVGDGTLHLVGTRTG